MMVYVKKGSVNRISSLILDSVLTEDGKFSFDLHPGNYLILEKRHLDKSVFEFEYNSTYYQLDRQCLAEWWEVGLQNVKIETSNIYKVDLHFYRGCHLPLDAPPRFYWIGPHTP